MVKARLRWVNVYPTIRKEEAHHKQEHRGQRGQGDNELLSASLLRPQPMLIRAWVMGRRVECTQSSGSPLFHRENCLHIQNEREKESTVKIFEQSIQTPCGLYWRQAAREQLLRMGNEEMAKTRRQFSGFFVMGCQNGFDLLRDLLIINCIICFLLHSSQEKRTPTLHQRPGHNSYHQRGWLDRSWLCKLSADGG